MEIAFRDLTFCLFDIFGVVEEEGIRDEGVGGFEVGGG